MNENARLSLEDSHDLRDALAVTKGWLDVLFHKWLDMTEEDRFRCVSGALLGANQLGYKIELLDGHPIDLRDTPENKMAEESSKLAERTES